MPTPRAQSLPDAAQDQADALRDARLRVLATSNETLTLQLAEYAVTMEAMQDTVRDTSRRLGVLEAGLGENNAMTSELLDIFKSLKGGFKVLGWLGSFAKWLTGIGAAFGLVWAAYHNWRP